MNFKALALAAITAGTAFIATAAPAQAGWQTCTWNGAPLSCVVDHTANGHFWTVTFENGSSNTYSVLTDEARVRNQNGMDEAASMRTIFVDRSRGLTAIDQNGGVLQVPFQKW